MRYTVEIEPVPAFVQLTGPHLGNREVPGFATLVMLITFLVGIVIFALLAYLLGMLVASGFLIGESAGTKIAAGATE